VASTLLPGAAGFPDHFEQALEDLAVLANAVVLELDVTQWRRLPTSPAVTISDVGTGGCVSVT